MRIADARTAFYRAVDQMESGDTDGATETILRQCLDGVQHNIFGHMSIEDVVRALGFVVVGTDICATSLRRMAGDPQPDGAPAEDIFIAMEVRNTSGVPLSFDDVFDGPGGATALRCVGAGLNHDFDSMSCVLKAHVETHGHIALFDVIADLVTLYVMLGCGHAKDDRAQGNHVS